MVKILLTLLTRNKLNKSARQRAENNNIFSNRKVAMREIIDVYFRTILNGK